MRGSYYGGSTVMGWGSYWERRYALGVLEAQAVPVKKGSKRKARRARAKAAANGEPTAAWAARKFPRSPMSQKDLLRELGMLPLPRMLLKRGEILKKLVADGLLLANGQPNPDHHKVRAVGACMGKTKTK